MANENSQFDPSQTQWYNATPEPEETKKPNYKKLVIIGLSIFGSLIVIVLTVFLIRNVLEPSITAKKTIEKNIENAMINCQDSKNIEKCLESASTILARENGDTAYCKNNSDEERDICLNATAITTGNREICSSIKELSLASNCSDAILATQIKSAGASIDLCAEYSTSELQDVCVANFLYQWAWAGDCTDQRISQLLCQSLAETKIAKEARDPGLCDVIKDAELVLACREKVGPGDLDLDGVLADEESYLGTSDTNSDTDADGLSDFDEIKIHKTDPSSQDTDRDGYNDGAEVRAGYDPLN